MPIIKSISDLRNKSHEISDLVHQENEPVFITKNGRGDMVVMSIEHFEKLQHKLDLHAKLAIAQSQKESGDKGKIFSHVMRDIRKKLNHAE